MILVAIMIVGGMAIILPFLHTSNDKTAKKLQSQEESKKKQMQDISSTPDAVKVKEIPQEEKEPEQFDKEQMYFENIESLYKYFTFSQVEDIKQRVQYYIHQNISKDILDCSIKTDTIKENNGKITFELTIKGEKYFEVQVTKDKNNKIIDCTILSSILN
jgi:hypothetical protein